MPPTFVCGRSLQRRGAPSARSATATSQVRTAGTHASGRSSVGRWPQSSSTTSRASRTRSLTEDADREAHCAVAMPVDQDAEGVPVTGEHPLDDRSVVLIHNASA